MCQEITKNNAALTAKKLEERGTLEIAQRLGFSIDTVTRAALGEGDALQQLRGQVDGFSTAASNASRVALDKGLSLDRASAAADKTASQAELLLSTVERESTAVGAAKDEWQRNAEAMETAEVVMQEMKKTAGGAIQTVAELTEEQKALGQALTSFVDPLGVYTELLSEKEAAERKSAEESAAVQNKSVDDQIEAVRRDYDAWLETARATGEVSKERIQQIEDERDAQIEGLDGQKKGWEDFTKGASVSLDEYARKLEEKNQAARDWQSNLVKVAGIAGSEVATHLANMGIQGAELTAEFANKTGAERPRAGPSRSSSTPSWPAPGPSASCRRWSSWRRAGPDDGRRDRLAGRDRRRAGARARGLVQRQPGGGHQPLLVALGSRPVGRLGANPRGGLQEFDVGGYTGHGGKHEPAGIVHGGEVVFTKEQTDKATVAGLQSYADWLDGYVDGGPVAPGGLVTTDDIPAPVPA